ncbi:hypothetical protein ACFWMR_19390 [Amycolatopsis thailandensis]|uniref:hypothetical protein n=1 Tax=Amycolatopsis thailandensis TaxID=589330 RepID=UPI003655526F
MTTVIFVHGTGVREKGYADSFRLMRGKAVQHWPGVTVLPCFWGDVLGVPLDAAAATVPEYDMSRGGDLTADEWRDDRWVLLEADPLYELRLLTVAHAGNGEVELPGSQVSAEDRLSAYLKWSDGLASLGGLLEQYGVDAEVFTGAVQAVFGSVAARDAIGLAAGSDSEDELREALARAVTAATLVAADGGAAGSFPVDAIGRDTIVATVLDGLHGADLGIGIGQTLLKVSASLVLRMGLSQAVERRRGMIMDRVTPFGGDVLRYLAHGDPLRRFIAETVRSVTGPVVVVAHSLGGIASLDVFRLGLAQADLLVTVGSQGSYLCSLGALPSAPSGIVGDVAMPPWVNVFDSRDLLSYLAVPVFGEVVEDVEVRSGAPFPRAHSAYFALDGFYTTLWDRLPR